MRNWHKLIFKKGRIWGPRCNYGNLKQKKWIFTWPNMALINMRFKDQIGLNLGEETVEKKRRREGEKKKKRRGRGRKESSKPRSRGMELWILYGTTWVSITLNGFPCNSIVICCTQT